MSSAIYWCAPESDRHMVLTDWCLARFYGRSDHFLQPKLGVSFRRAHVTSRAL